MLVSSSPQYAGAVLARPSSEVRGVPDRGDLIGGRYRYRQRWWNDACLRRSRLDHLLPSGSPAAFLWKFCRTVITVVHRSHAEPTPCRCRYATAVVTSCLHRWSGDPLAGLVHGVAMVFIQRFPLTVMWWPVSAGAHRKGCGAAPATAVKPAKEGGCAAMAGTTRHGLECRK